MACDQLSLLAQFDDLRRNRRILTQGIETEFERFVRFQEDWRLRLLSSDDANQQLREKLHKLESAYNTLELKLKHARSQLDNEIRKRKLAEQDKHVLEQKFGLISELINDKDRNGQLDERDRQRLEFINSDYQPTHYESPRRNMSTIDESASILSDCDIYDKTGEDLDTSYLRSGRKYKYPKADDDHSRAMDQGEGKENREGHSPERKKRSVSRKKHRRSRSAGAVVTAKLTVVPGNSGVSVDPMEGSPTPTEGRCGSMDRRTMRKCNSATTPTGIPPSVSTDELYGRTRNASGHSLLRELNRQVTPPSGLRRNGSNNNLRRPHTFMPRTSIKPGESCQPCGKRIGFGKSMVKCKDCRTISHDQCKDDVPLPCIATAQTPSKNTKNLLGDYVPSERPFIPSLVVHCVQEIENRGLEEQGLYRVPGAEKEVRELKERFYRGKAIPNLSQVHDINVVCGCLKAFFKDLRDSLLTSELWSTFVTAAALSDRDEAATALYQAISELPQANRDTLAFLMLHLQKVSESPRVLMTVHNLSTVFGPTLVGYSVPNPEPMQMMKETNDGQKVVSALMQLSPDYWEKLLQVSDNTTLYPSMHVESPITTTPSNRASVYESMLGPVLTPTGTPGGAPTPYQDRSRPWTTTPRHKGFFNSPVI